MLGADVNRLALTGRRIARPDIRLELSARGEGRSGRGRYRAYRSMSAASASALSYGPLRT
jgi:hypothetical protein